MRIVTVKRATFVFVGIAALCVAFLAGCGSKSSTSGPSRLLDPDGKPWPTPAEALANAPETKIRQFPNPQDRANYLKSLPKDRNFDPKMHVPFLEEQAKDSDPDVANAAKDLLDRAK
jgi:hypothetical protein